MTDDFWQALEDGFREGNDYLTASTRDRPYNGQSHTDQGERGKQEVHGITMRDVRDCMIMGMFQAAEYLWEDDPDQKYRHTLYDLPWDDIDIGAALNNAICEIENRMGIWPNLPGYTPRPREND